MKKIILTAALIAFVGGVSIAQTPETTKSVKSTTIKKDQDGKKKNCSSKKSCCSKKGETAEAKSGKKSCCASKEGHKTAEKKKAVK